MKKKIYGFFAKNQVKILLYLLATFLLTNFFGEKVMAWVGIVFSFLLIPITFINWRKLAEEAEKEV